MQKKTISKQVAKKMEDWLSTITDETLRKDVRKNIIVSGGCIASLFLNEPVNDYDVYIQNIDVLKRLVSYYTKGIDGITILDGRVDFLTKEELEYVDLTQLQRARKNLDEKQIKIFLEDGKGVYKADLVEDQKYQAAFVTPNAISLTDDLQIVVRFCGTVEEIHASFDYIHATNYFTFEDGVVTNLAAVESLLSRTLKYQGSRYPLTSIIRARKFIKRKWNIGAGELLKIMFQISSYDLKNPDVLEDQLIGVDVAYFSILIEALQSKYKSDPEFELTPTYLTELIERIFDNDTFGEFSED
jgi:hypothetical protein